MTNKIILTDLELEKVNDGTGTTFNVNEVCTEIFGMSTSAVKTMLSSFLTDINTNGNSTQKSAANKLNELLNKETVDVTYLLGCLGALTTLKNYAKIIITKKSTIC